MASDAEEVAAALRVSVGMLVRSMRRLPPAGELTLPETSALARLDRGGPSSASELARLERISPQSMGATVAALEARGLVERRPDPADGRRSVLSISPAGARLLGDRRAARVQQLARALEAEFAPEELERLNDVAPLLERLAQRL